MSRVKNASFVGSPPRDVVADASIFNRWMKNAIGDVALVTDKVTGANSETPITHTGAGDGCQLRLPKAAQHIDRSLVISGSAIAEQGAYIIAVPVFVPAGEAGPYRLEVLATLLGNEQLTASVMSSTGTIDYQADGIRSDLNDASPAVAGPQRTSRESLSSWSITLGAGLSYILVSRPCRFEDADPGARLISWALDNDRTYAGESNGLSINGGGAAITSPYEAPSTFTPSTVHDTYDEEIGVGAPLSAYVLTRLNRHLNALWEYVTGAKIPGNATYKNATTWDNSRASFTAEGLLDFPMCILALGSILDDTGKPSVNDYTTNSPTDGMLDWLMHPTAHAAVSAFTSVVMVCPSFSTSSSALKCAVLIHTPNAVGDAANWRFDVSSTAGTATEVTPVQIGSTNFHVATVAAVPFTASATNLFSVRLRHTGAVAALTEEIDILGLCFYFDP